MSKIFQILPILTSLKSYQRSDLIKDFVAGMTVWVMLAPQGMAYAFLAGMPPIYGLYGGLVPLFLYGIFGSSRQLSIGPVAISSLLVLSGVSQIAEPFSEEYISLVIATGLIIGAVQLIMGLVRLGFLVNFLSNPVVAGFTSAAAIIIGINQLKDILGIQVPRLSHIHETFIYVVQHLGQTNWISLLMGAGSISLMLLIKKFKKGLPESLIIVALGIGIVALFSLDAYGLPIIGSVPEGLPAFSIPYLDSNTLLSLLYTTIIPVALVGIVESIGIAKGLEAKHGNYRISPNQELFAIGISKIVGAFFQSSPSSASYSRSAVNSDAGAVSGISSIFTAFLILLSLLFLTPIFYYLPKAILAAIILMAVIGLFNWKEAKYLWKAEKLDFVMMLITFFATLIIGIGAGVLVGVSISILVVMYKSSRPHIVELGLMPNSTHYRNINRFEEAEVLDEFLIVRMDEQLFYANADFFKRTVDSFIDKRVKTPAYLLLNAQSVHYMDSTGIHTLKDLYLELKNKGIQMVICGAIGPVRDKMHVSGLMDLVGKKHFFLYVDHAVQCLQNNEDHQRPHIDWTYDAVQTDIQD